MVFGLSHPREQGTEEPRGRVPTVATGRGGAGNMIRSPSRGKPVLGAEEIAAYHATADNPPSTISAGRGGVGNVRSPSRDPADRARIANAEQRDQERQDEYRRRELMAHHYAPSGRGGLGNIHQEGTAPPDRSHSHTRLSSQERGRREGPVGSFLRGISRSRSRDPRPSESSDSGRRASFGSTFGGLPHSVNDETSRTLPPGYLADVHEKPEMGDNNEH